MPAYLVEVVSDRGNVARGLLTSLLSYTPVIGALDKTGSLTQYLGGFNVSKDIGLYSAENQETAVKEIIRLLEKGGLTVVSGEERARHENHDYFGELKPLAKNTLRVGMSTGPVRTISIRTEKISWPASKKIINEINDSLSSETNYTPIGDINLT